jgi:menaquinone-dependent protoporphyrinogen oxidase
MLLLYATRDGQARRIATHIAGRLAEREATAAPRDLAEGVPAPAALSAAGLVVAVLAVRYGRHLPQAERFLAAFATLAEQPPLVLLSVNLTARKPGKDSPEGNVYLRKSIARYRLAPVLAAAIAGRLDYPGYRWFDRQMIRLIMRMTGGPTDPRAQVEFTDWTAVDAVAARIAGLRDATMQQSNVAMQQSGAAMQQNGDPANPSH